MYIKDLLQKEDVIKSMRVIYLGSIQQRIEFVFRMYDFNDDGYVAPSDKLNLAAIGSGGMGESGLNEFSKTYR